MRNVQNSSTGYNENHIYKNLDLNEHFEKVENETKTVLQFENIEPSSYCI